jgi:autotransporter-associated beta strand protein
MQNKTTLHTHNEILPVSEPWHRGSGFTWMLLALAGLVFFLSGAAAKAQFTFATDNAGNYGGNWSNGSDGGSGFGGWGLTAGANSGSFIGSPANDGMGTTGIGTTAFGMWSSGSGYMNASRGFDAGMQVGDKLSFQWAMNWDANSGSKGFDLKSGGTTVFNLNNGGSSTITVTGGTVSSNYGTSPMNIEITRTSSSQYSVTIGKRDGGENYAATLNSSSSIDNLNFYIGNQNDGNGNRNIYFNNLTIGNNGTYGNTQTESRALTGNGALTVNNSATLTLTSDGNNFTGGTSVASGSTLSIGNGGFSGRLSGNVANSGTLKFDRSGDTLFYSGQVSGSGALNKSGGGQVNLIGASTYSGATTVAAGILEAQHGEALGSIAAGTTVESGAQLKLYNGTSMTVAEALTLNGDGGGGGALRNEGGDNTVSGNINLGSGSRINSSGSSGSLAISGNIDGGANVLYSGGSRNTSISGVIGGTGASQNGTITSLYKDDAGSLTLSGNNSYSGDTRVVAGALTVASGGSLGNGTSDVFVSSGATLNVNANTTVASLQETGTGNGGTASIGSGATLTINQASETKFFNALTGEGSLAKSGAGRLSVYGTSSKSGANTVSGGVLEVQSGASLAGATTINDGGTLDAEGTLSGAVTVNSGGTVEGSGSVGALTIASGGTLSPGNSPGKLTASSATWAGGGIYEWEINNWLGVQETNWDFLSVSGVLDITATSASKFIIDIVSLLANNTGGVVPGFWENDRFTFAIATAAGGITNFSANAFTLDTSRFLSDTGTWSIGQTGNSIELVYSGTSYLASQAQGASAIPEPSSASMLVLGLAAGLAKRRRVARG